MTKSGTKAFLTIAAAVTLLAVALPSGALAAHIKTASKKVTVPPGADKPAKATCPHGTNLVGGGFAITPKIVEDGAILTGSHPAGARSWVASALNYPTDTVSSSITSYAYCEKGALGMRTVTKSARVGGVPTASGIDSKKLAVRCPHGLDALAGGFSDARPGPPTYASAVAGVNRRASKHVWQLQGIAISVTPASRITAYADCGKPARKQAAKTAHIPQSGGNGNLGAATARCHHGTTGLSGGWAVGPFKIGRAHV